MKNKLIALALVLVFVGESFPIDRCGPTTLPGERILITEHGTLINLFGANGKSLYGKLDHDGFSVRYLAGGKEISVSAMGSRKPNGLVPGKVKLDGKFASVTVTTKDKLLGITSYFKLDTTGTKLTIYRVYKNLSSQKLVILGRKQHLDRKLLGKGKFRVEPGRVLEYLSPERKSVGRLSGEPGRLTRYLDQLNIAAWSSGQETVGSRDSFCERVWNVIGDVGDCDPMGPHDCPNEGPCPTGGQCYHLSQPNDVMVDVDIPGTTLVECPTSEEPAKGKDCSTPEMRAKNECEYCRAADGSTSSLPQPER